MRDLDDMKSKKLDSQSTYRGCSDLCRSVLNWAGIGSQFIGLWVGGGASRDKGADSLSTEKIEIHGSVNVEIKKD